MGVLDVLKITRGFSREEKTLLFQYLSTQIAEEFSADEVTDIKRAVAEGDSDFESGQYLTTKELAKELGL